VNLNAVDVVRLIHPQYENLLNRAVGGNSIVATLAGMHTAMRHITAAICSASSWGVWCVVLTRIAGFS
jgi:hypothetical protein